MNSATETAFDPVEELRWRRWARENYVPAERRDPHLPVAALDEMRCRDAELEEAACQGASGRRVVPLLPQPDWILHPPHVERTEPEIILRLPDVSHPVP